MSPSHPTPVAFDHRPFAALTPSELHDVLRLRGDVFVVELGISEENDLDGTDPRAVHVLGTAPAGELVATARVLLDVVPAVVSRITVRRDLRGAGMGTRLMRYVQEHLLEGPAVMSAQAHLESWYRRLGWTREGPTYDEVGIPHVRMVWSGTCRSQDSDAAQKSPT